MRRFRWIAVVCAAALATALTAGSAAGQGGRRSQALAASDVGISPTEIRIGVVADTGSSLAPGLFQGAVDATQAWAKYMNEKEGGLAGRKIVVDTYDSSLDANKSRNAIIEACGKDFAIIATSALFLNNIDDLVACKDIKGAATGLPDFPIVTTEVVQQCSPVSHGVNPPILDCSTKDQHPQTYRGSLGATSYYLKKFGKNALHGVFIYPSDIASAKNSQVPAFTAQQQAGIKQDATFDVSARAQQSAYTPFVQALKDNSSTYARSGSNDAGWISFMKEAKLQGVNTIKVWDCSLQCYDKDILAAPETEGLYVWTLFLPLDETKSNKMLGNYVKYMGADKADGFGAQGWASGILLRDAVNQAAETAGNKNITRADVLKAADGITQFDADGMIAQSNPGEGIPSNCFVLNQVKGGKFVRVFPKKAGTFQCEKNNAYTIKMDLIKQCGSSHTVNWRQNRSTWIAAFVVAILVGYVIAQSWRGAPVTFDSILFTLVVGVTIGSIYAVAASGLVVTYTTSGIFNFAQGAMGMFGAFVYWQLKVDWGVPTIPSLILSVLVFAPLFGALVERVLMRRLTTAPLVAKLVVTIGLMVALMGLAVSIWDPNTGRTIPPLFPTSEGFTVGETFVPWFRFTTIVTGLGLALVMRVLLHRTRLGIAMRAVVDHRDLAALNGARPGRTSMFAWALGTAMAAIAGIFLAEELSNLSVEILTLFIVDAFAAAIIGRLRSLPLTYLGGMIIGLSIAFQSNFLTWSLRWSSASFAIPTMILFLALLFVPQARIEGRQITSKVTPRVPTLKRAAMGMLVLFGFMLVMAATWDRIGNRNLTLVMLYAFMMLSLVPLTGWSGQISLGQVVFVGIGAFVLVQGGAWSPFGDLPNFNGNPLGLLLAAACAVPFGVLIALPAVRLQGLYLALATMAFARMAEFIVFDQPEVFGGQGKRIAPIRLFGFGLNEPFTLLGVHFSEDSAMLLFVTALFGIAGFGVVAMRRGAFGRRLVAMRDSPAACATLGVNLFWTKVAVFAISAAIAGFAGALNGTYLGSASTQDFQMLKGLPLLILLVVGGVSVVSGAVFGGFALQSFAWLVQLFPASTYPTLNKWLVYWSRIGPGLAGIGIGRNPDGAVVEISAAVHGDRKRKPPALPPGDGPQPVLVDATAEPAAPARVAGGEA